MGLKRKVSSLNNVPAELRKFYVETDDGFVLDIEGHDPAVEMLEQKNEYLSANLFRARLVNRVGQALARAKINASPSVMEDIMLRADEIYNGLDSRGEPICIDEDGQLDESKTFDWFVKQLAEEAPHLVSLQGGSSDPKKRGTPRGIEVDPNDPKSFGANIDAIAKGKVDVHLKSQS